MVQTTVVLVRHGQTHENVTGVLQGQDPHRGHLTERGIAQAVAAGAALSGEAFDRIYCSPLARAVTTLGRILEARGLDNALPLHFDPDLREGSMGAFHGRTQADWKVAAERADDLLRFVPEGGESQVMLQSRVGVWFARTVERHPGESILVVAHGGVVRGILTHLLDLPMVLGWAGAGNRPGMHNACISRVVMADGGLVSVSADDTRHLGGLVEQPSAGETFDFGARQWVRVTDGVAR